MTERKLEPFPSWAFPRDQTDMGNWREPFLTHWECANCKETDNLSGGIYDCFGTWKFYCHSCKSETRVTCGFPQHAWCTGLGVDSAEQVAIRAGLDKEMSFEASRTGWQYTYNEVVEEHNARVRAQES